MQINVVETRAFSAAAAALALAFGLVSPAVRADSGVAACRVTTYYADASMTIKVGTASTCPTPRDQNGSVKSANVDVFESGTARREPSLPPGALPCEFQADCKPLLVAAPADARLR